jgi:tetratricopeptide (TPR) repeat protein
MPAQNGAVAYRGLANCLLRLGDYPGALEACRHAASLDEGYALPRMLAAMALCRLQRPAEALEELEVYLRLTAERQTAAARVLEHEGSRGFALALKGDCLLTLGLQAEAEAAFREAVRLYPDAPEGYMGLGRIHGLRGEFAEAARAFERAQVLFRDLPRGHLALAEAYAAQRDWGRALSPLEEFLKAEPDEPRALALRAEALLHLGRHAEAEAAYRQVLERDPTPEAHLALACLAESRGAAEQVLTHCQAARDLGGEDPRLYFLEGKMRLARREWVAAESSLLEALRRSPDTPEIYESLGAVALARGEYAQALGYLTDLIRLAPDNPVARRAVPVLQVALAAG